MPEVKQHKEEILPFRGEIVDYPGTGKILVLVGYHKLEVGWGRAIKDQFQKYIQDPGRHVTFYELTDQRRANTGDDSISANFEIMRKIDQMGSVEMVIDLHEHPGALATRVYNSWSVTTDNADVIQEAKVKIKELRTYPFDDHSRGRTARKNIPYAITDPDLPKGGVKDYENGVVSDQMQEALNDSLSFLVNLANIQLAASAKK